jgi:hypothetical protein
MHSSPLEPRGARTAGWRRWPVLGVALLCAACAGPDVPFAESHAPKGQKTMRAVQHWDVLADDIASRIAEKTREWPPGAHPIYVAARTDARFNQGLRKLLILRLVDRGITVATEPTAAVHLVVDAQVVQHIQPGSSALHWMPLASGVSVARDGVHFHGSSAYSAAPAAEGRAAVAAPAATAEVAPVPAPSAFGVILPPMPGAVPGAAPAPAAPAAAAVRRPGGAAQDTPVLYPRPGVPDRSEVLVVVSLESGGRYLAGTSDVYSVAHDDALLYLAPEPLLPGPQPAPMKTWRVVSP